MKIFIDTASIGQIMKINELGILDGVTTNPTLLAKEAKSGKTFEEIIGEICDVVDGDVSVEAVSTDATDIIMEARELSKISENVVIKVAMGKEGLKAVSKLSTEGIKTNMTLIFSSNQGILAAKAGATYVSPFIGRLDDIGHRGMDIVEDMVDIFDINNFESEIIVASVRHPLHVIEAARIGADVITIPFDVLEKMIEHPLTDKGIETFLNDWNKVKK
ncbi:MAG: fructose-6-phosphate aldolase [Candidatus Altiarchaeales archaeon WOR_SM1_86-2]|nr:MAG: fructose-6-phosphate aldolase [Candidatus Altiarchaeales archaeon WOR_SM1_86-2]